MIRTVVALLATVMILAGCSQSDSRPDPTPAPTSAPPPARLVIDYGRVGPAEAGMTHTEAMATGVFRDDLPQAVDGCPAPPIAWKKPHADKVDVIESDGLIHSLGVGSPVLKTKDGVHVGSTLGDVKAAYPDLIGPETAGVGYNQSGAWARSGDRWIGFLFGKGDEQPLTDASEVVFIEVTNGVKPDLIRDGC